MERYDNWTAGHQEIFDNIPGVPLFPTEDQREAEALYYAGFIDRDMSPDDRRAAREEFFDFTGLPEEAFSWADWREEEYPET